MNRNTRFMLYALVMIAVIAGMMDCAKRMKKKTPAEMNSGVPASGMAP